MEEHSGIEELIKFWAEFDCTSGDRRVHDADQGVMNRAPFFRLSPNTTLQPVERYLEAGPETRKGFHLALTPVPYVGDLRSSDIFLLMVNPTVGYSDYGTDSCPAFQ